MEIATAFLEFMCAKGTRHDPSFKLRPSLPDPDDEFVLELAFAANADYLVTHNLRDFAGSDAFGVSVISPGALVRILRGAK